MSASLKPLYVEEFLAWERAQPERYEFDGIQPVAMTGGGQHVRIITRLIVALGYRVKPPCEVFGTDLKVQPVGRIRYPDASVVCSDGNDTDEIIEPTAVFEVVSPSTALTDRRVKPADTHPFLTLLFTCYLNRTGRKPPSCAEALAGNRKRSQAQMQCSRCRRSG